MANNSGNLDNDLDSSDQQVLATLQQFLKNHVPQSANEVKFNKKLLDFDYSDDEEGQNDFSEPTPQMIEALAAILSNERLLNKLKVKIDYFAIFLSVETEKRTSKLRLKQMFS